jgi:hypothetical protein
MHEDKDVSQKPVENPAGDRPRPAKRLRLWHYCALAVPFCGLLWPPLYARWTPEFFGIPFFYAYQFAWIFLSAGLTALVYRSITR